jgi:NADH dehydrogenase
MNIQDVLLIGGSGFLGRHVAHVLSARGVRVTVPTRHRARAGHLLPLPTVEVIEADVHDPATLAKLCRGKDTVINLVGVLHSPPGRPYGPAFARAHVELPTEIVTACHQVGVPRLLQVSALKAAPDAPSEYLRSKAAGEAAVRAFKGAWTLFQPSVIFGAGDSFLTLFAKLVKHTPLQPLACAQARFQPVFVEDVARIVCDALDDEAAFNQTFEVCGPRVYTLMQLVEYVGQITGHPARVLPLPPLLGYLQAWVLEHLPGTLMSRDNLASMRIDNVSFGPPQPRLAGVTREPTALESVAPTYLAARTPRARFAAFRTHARR